MRTSTRTADDRGQDVKEAEDDGASFRGVGRRRLEFEEIEAGEALDRGSAGDSVVAGALTRRGPTRAFRNVQRNGNGRAVELIGQFGTPKRKPSNNDASELDGEAIRVEAMEGRSGSGDHRRGSFREEGRD